MENSQCNSITFPLHKKDEKDNPKNYRPISLTSCVCKVLEKIIFKHIHNHCKDNNLLSKKQSGFTPKDNTTNQLCDLYNSICISLDNSRDLRAVFLDISKAFDKVWTRGLLSKIKSFRIKGKLFNWIIDYLTNRKQRVFLDGKYSKWSEVKAGVPQGSILGPIFFLIYINDLTENIKSNIRLFADDTMIYAEVDDPKITSDLLNSDLERINNWSKRWLVNFSPEKTRTLTFSTRRTKQIYPDLYLNNIKIKETDNHKHLGLTFSNNGKWEEHLDNIGKKTNKRLNMIKQLQFNLDRQTLQTLYFTYVRPLMEYGDIVWNNINENQTEFLETIQRTPARLVTGAVRRTKHAAIQNELEWQILARRRENHQLILLHKIVNEETPSYLKDKIHIEEENYYYNRNRENTPYIRPIFARTNLYFNSFFPSVIRKWNSLNKKDKNQPLEVFKNELNKRQKPSAYFTYGSRPGQIYLARLRMLCSNLNHHKCLRYLSDDPTCKCGHHMEDIKHYLFECSEYSNIRNSTLNTLPIG